MMVVKACTVVSLAGKFVEHNDGTLELHTIEVELMDFDGTRSTVHVPPNDAPAIGDKHTMHVTHVIPRDRIIEALHMDHAQSCGCLNDSAVCCDNDCPCF